MPEKVDKTDEEWMRLLTPEQYRVTRAKGTNLLSTTNITILKEKAYISVYVVVANCSILKQSLSQEQAGQAFGILPQSKVLKRLQIKALA